MLIKFFGTAAAEGIPALFCECDSCEEARKKGGKYIRTRSQSLIDNKILIDLPADTYHHVISHNLPLHKIYSLLITHHHSDHYYPTELYNRRKGFSYLKDDRAFKIFAVKSVIEYTKSQCDEKLINEMLENKELELNEIEVFKTFETDGYKITPLKAVHGTTEPVIYLITKDNKTILYAHDTHYFDESVWEYLKENNVFLNLVSLDCTQANDSEMRYIGHMNLNDNIKVKNRLLEMKAADENTIFVCNHFSHNGKDVSYGTFEAIAEENGFLTAYDGLELEF